MSEPWIFNRCKVINVVDGDTVDVEVDLGFLVATRMRVRLYGVNTPERGQPLWGEAKDFVTNQTLGIPVKLISHKPKDKYGRFLATIIRHDDGMDVNQALIDRGLAVPYMV